MADLSYTEATLGKGKSGRVLNLNGRLAYVDPAGRAFWLRPGPRIREAAAIQALRELVQQQDAKKTGLVVPP